MLPTDRFSGQAEALEAHQHREPTSMSLLPHIVHQVFWCFFCHVYGWPVWFLWLFLVLAVLNKSFGIILVYKTKQSKKPHTYPACRTAERGSHCWAPAVAGHASPLWKLGGKRRDGWEIQVWPSWKPPFFHRKLWFKINYTISVFHFLAAKFEIGGFFITSCSKFGLGWKHLQPMLLMLIKIQLLSTWKTWIMVWSA